VVSAAWDILCESAFFVLIGFAVAGILQVLLSGETVIRHLSGTKKRSVFLATLVGVPLPLCSCSVLPAAVMLRKKGASKGATLSFLISTPETSVTSIILTYSLLGPLMAVIRPIAACVTAIVAGLMENLVEQHHTSPAPKDEDANPCCSGNCGEQPSPPSVSHRLREGMQYAFVDLFDDIFGWILIGILAAAAIQSWLPPDALNTILGGPLQSMLLMVLIGIPLYVCAEASTPIAAALILQGMNPGAALVLLLVGPATNIGSLGVLHQHFGRRAVIVYLATIIVMAIVMGGILNNIVAGVDTGLAVRVLDEPLVPLWLKSIGAIVFLAIGLGSIRRLRYAQRLAVWLNAKLPVPVSAGGVRVAVGIVLTIVYAGSGLFTIRPGEVGIVRRFGVIQNTSVPPGLHYAFPYPIDQVDRVPVQRVYRLPIGFGPDSPENLTGEFNLDESWNLVGDENIADIKLAVHWGAMEDKITHFQYGIADREELVRSVVLGAARELFGGGSINRVFTGSRRDYEQKIKRLAQSQLGAYDSGILIHSFHILDAHAPTEVHAAFRDVASALEDRSTQINQARGYQARVIPEARGEAAEHTAEARGYASRMVSLATGNADRFLSLLHVYTTCPEVTRRRLELETLERVLPRLRKYLKPPASDVGELEIWLVNPGAVDNMSTLVPG